MSVSPSMEARTPRPGTEYNTQTRNLPGAHTRKTCVGVRVCGLCALRGSARCLLKALHKVPRPPGAFPPACGLRCVGRGWRGGGVEGREGGNQGERGKGKTRGSLQEREASGTHRGARSLGAGLEPSRRRGAAAEPSLVRLGRRPQQRNPGRRWAGGGSYRRAISEARAKRESWGCGPERRGPAAAPRGPGCAGLVAERTPRTQNPAPARQSPPLNYLRLWPRRRGGAASCTSPPLGALAERGNSFPLTSSSEMQKISDFDR